MTVPVARVSGRAARFVHMLRDFGHLDAEGADRLLLGAMDMLGPGGVVELRDVRRAAAMMLFSDPGEPGSPHLAADWPILFS